MNKKIGFLSSLLFLIMTCMCVADEIQDIQTQFKGERLSLNFQDIEVRAVLQLIADFTQFNLIVSDTVQGSITLRLQNVPWDQALDIVLKSKSLDKREVGNVWLIGPASEIAAREKLELQSLQQIEDLGPLKSELIQINYAKADDIATLLKEKSNSLMTSRGNVTVDKRTNTLLIQDTIRKLKEIKNLIKKLDIPVRQVEILTQIVSADRSLEETLGVRFGGISSIKPKEGGLSDLSAPHISTGQTVAKAGFTLARLPKEVLLDLELQALEYETHSKIIARPKLMTIDQNKASVEQGVEIPYQEATASGATSTSYRKAVLKLEVTPQITPDNKIALDLQISNDTPEASGSQRIKTNRLQTKVLVDNGETVVLGGILTLNDKQNRAKLPILGNMPILGGLFRNKYIQDERKELIIFMTPRIIVK